eukprot:m.72573 g.72573  ORF g.72573 m.72573 type:complete len:89 (-) comp8388_c1_seq1:910-1176(-)
MHFSFKNAIHGHVHVQIFFCFFFFCIAYCHLQTGENDGTASVWVGKSIVWEWCCDTSMDAPKSAETASAFVIASLSNSSKSSKSSKSS